MASYSESGWCIEHAESEVSYPRYWGGTHGWTHDNLQAVRFAREEDARSQAATMNDGNHRVADHMWVDQNRTDVAAGVLTALKRYVADYDPESPPEDMPDAGCIECTVGTVPNNLNTGLCKYHEAVVAIALTQHWRMK